MPVFTISVSDEAYAGVVDIVKQFLQQGQLLDTSQRDGEVVGLAPVSARGLAPSSSISQAPDEPSPQLRPVIRTTSIPRILAQTQQAVDGVIALTGTMGDDINELQEMRNDVEDVRGNVDEMRDNVTEMQGNVDEMREDVNKVRDMQDDLETVIRKVAALENAKKLGSEAAEKRAAAVAGQVQLARGTQESPAGGKTVKQLSVTSQDVDAVRNAQIIENLLLCVKVAGVVVGVLIAYALAIIFGPGLITVVGLVGWVMAMLVLHGYRFRFNI